MIRKKTHPQTTGNFRLLPVCPNSYAIVDVQDFEHLKRYRWFLAKSNSCSYAIRRIRHNGHSTSIRLHREIMNTPPDMDCHHKNGKTLDCRRCNLANMTPGDHRALEKAIRSGTAISI